MTHKLLTFLLFVTVFLASLYNSADLDLGWHLKYGEHFVNPPAGESRILKVNTFSSEMTNYKYPNTSWASDVILYIIYSKFGFLGISLLGALIITLTFYFFAKAANLTLFQKSLIFPLMIYLLAPQNAASFRAQSISFLFLGILFYLLLNPGRKKFDIGYLKFDIRHLFIPPLFFVWANSHGEYLTGLALFAVFTAVEIGISIIKRTTRPLIHVTPLITVFALSIIATLINPFGINIYLESLRHFGNPLQKFVIEWLPNEIFSAHWWNLVATGLVSVIGLIILIKNKKQKTTYYPLPAITFLLLALSFWSRRYSWNFYYMSIFLLAPIILAIETKDRKINFVLCSIIVFIFFIFALSSKMPLSQFQNMTWDKYCLEYVSCSPQSIKFLKKNSLGQNLYTHYDWGGYIIWNNKEIKPSMDGRMALWRDESGYSAFENYYALQQNQKDIDKSNYDTVLISPKKPLYLRLKELVSDGKWQLAYHDQNAAVFTRR